MHLRGCLGGPGLHDRDMPSRPSLALIVLSLAAALAMAQAAQADSNNQGGAPATVYQISTRDLAVRLSPVGRIESVTLGGKHVVRPLQAYSELAGCERVGPPAIDTSGDGGVCFVQRWIHRASRGECTLQERFFPGQGSVRWEVEITGLGDPWSTAIETHLDWSNEKFPAKLWLAQGGVTVADPPMHFVTRKLDGRTLDWSDPLELLSFGEMRLGYGGQATQPGFSLPMVTLVEPDADRGLTLALSPENDPASMTFEATAGGQMVFARSKLRISKGRVLRLAMDLLVHEGDWRPALGWMVQRYPGYFNPPNPKAARIAGCGAFCSSYAGPLDAAKMKAMGCRVNWGYGFTMPYIGMYLPYVNEGEAWVSFEGRKESTRTLDALAQKWQEAGIHTLAEFVTTEWGYKSLDGKRIPVADRKAGVVSASSFSDGESWKDATAYLLEKLPGSVLFGDDAKPVFSQLDVPLSNVVVDPGEPVFAAFLVDQARRFVKEVPHCAGICIDRMDWLEQNNPRRDDGVSWVDGKPARSLRVSWLGIMDQLGEVLHGADKAIFANPHIKRLDLMRQVDGIFDEYGYLPFNNNATAFLGLRKPVMAWTPGEDFLRQDPDAFFQRYLYLGIFPMAPFPENATAVPWLYAIQPGAWAEQQYRDYGPLLDLNQGKQWVLEPHVVKVKDDLAKVNLFEVSQGYAMPVVFGGTRPMVTVLLRKFPGLPAKPVFEVLHPAATDWVTVSASTVGTAFQLEVPLRRGCAMVRVRPQGGQGH